MTVKLDPWLITIISTIVASVFSAAVSGFIVHRIQRKLNKRDLERDKKEEEREKANKEYNMLMLQGLIASLSLGEATADAVETHKYNGKQQKAREYAEGVKHEIQDFMYRQGAEHLN